MSKNRLNSKVTKNLDMPSIVWDFNGYKVVHLTVQMATVIYVISIGLERCVEISAPPSGLTLGLIGLILTPSFLAYWSKRGAEMAFC